MYDWEWFHENLMKLVQVVVVVGMMYIVWRVLG